MDPMGLSLGECANVSYKMCPKTTYFSGPTTPLIRVSYNPSYPFVRRCNSTIEVHLINIEVLFHLSHLEHNTQTHTHTMFA